MPSLFGPGPKSATWNLSNSIRPCFISPAARHLISEAARGEGAYLRDVTGYRFMGDYDPALELAPRDVVSLAITTQMAKTRHPCVYLDLSHLPTRVVDERFPHIRKVCARIRPRLFPRPDSRAARRIT